MRGYQGGDGNAKAVKLARGGANLAEEGELEYDIKGKFDITGGTTV